MSVKELRISHIKSHLQVCLSDQLKKRKNIYEQIIKQQDNMYAKWKNYKNAPCAIIIGKPNHFINLKLELSDWSSFFLS